MVTVSDEAAAKVAEMLEQQGNAGFGLRVAVMGGGCSGFQYKFSLADKENADDLRIVRDDAVILIDETSVSLLQGSAVDYYEGLDGSMFTIANPNATSSCGCGTSFAI